MFLDLGRGSRLPWDGLYHLPKRVKFEDREPPSRCFAIEFERGSKNVQTPRGFLHIEMSAIDVRRGCSMTTSLASRSLYALEVAWFRWSGRKRKKSRVAMMLRDPASLMIESENLLWLVRMFTNFGQISVPRRDVTSLPGGGGKFHIRRMEY